MRELWALSDLHLERPQNRAAIEELPAQPDDWLVLAGDVCERPQLFDACLALLAARWQQVVWVPGNHELWSAPDDPLRGEARYLAFVEMARRAGVLTPEDPYPLVADRLRLVPLFLLYDYSFAPDGLDPAGARAWALEEDIVCGDEVMLAPAPYPSREAWCAARCDAAEARLLALDAGDETLLVNHFPLRQDLVRLPRLPRFSPWCGTRRTEDWHRRFRARAVVSGHLHVRATDWRDGVRFEEVSLGYPRDWIQARGARSYLRRIWPG